MEKRLTLMRKGLSELRKTSSVHQPNFSWNHLENDKIHPSKAFHAVKQYYEKQTEEQKKTTSVSSYVSDSGELQKYFLKRPGCPQYSHQATTTSPFEISFSRVGDAPINLSTMSLTSQISLDDWNCILQNSELMDSKSHIKFCTSSSSEIFPGLPKWKSFTEGIVPHSQLRIRSGMKIPWYVPVLREKDQSLTKLGEEVTRLAPFEAECTRKDGVIAVLVEEVQKMQKELDQLQKQLAVILPKPSEGKSPLQKRAEEEAWMEGDVPKLPQISLSPSVRYGEKNVPLIHMDPSDIPEQLRQEVERLKSELSSLEQMDSKAVMFNMALMRDQEELQQLEKEGLMENAEESISSSGSKTGELELGDLEESENALILYKLLEFQKVNEMLYEELQKMHNEYELSTGAISSLQRQLSFEESQLRKANIDQELLQKELRERGEQLEAMSRKFCNLREERKHEEMMGSIERENYKIQQEVARLEIQLADRDQMINSLQNSVSQLQSELLVSQHYTGKQLTSQEELQRQLDILQRVEQGTRVTLESISARFERFRNKIIQAAYSTPGTKSPQAEITDDEVLEALQKIITDRLDFHQLLKQKGVKVPSLSSEPAPPTVHKKKTGSK